MMVLICGTRKAQTRDWWDVLASQFKKLTNENPDLKVIHGDAKGIDTLANEVALKFGIETTIFEANWRKYKKSAGPIRNAEMIDQNPDLVLAFTDSLGSSLGTFDCVKQASEKGILAKVINSKGGEFLYLNE